MPIFSTQSLQLPVLHQLSPMENRQRRMRTWAALLPTAICRLLVAFGVVLLAACGASNDASESQTADTASYAAVDQIEACLSQEPVDLFTTPEDLQADTEQLTVCQNAASKALSDTNLLHRIGILQLRINHVADARLTFQSAADLGSCYALTFLGDFAWYQDKDTTSALTTYNRAVQCGDQTARTKVYDSTTYSVSAYPHLVRALYESDIVTLNRERYKTASFLSGFWSTFSEMYLSGKMTPCWKATLYSGGDVTLSIEAAERGNARSVLEEKLVSIVLPWIPRLDNPALGPDALTRQREALRQAGQAEAVRMIESSECDALLPVIFIRGVHVFASTPRTLAEQLPDVAPQFRTLDELGAYIARKLLGF
jgi:hypothetical protein